MNINDEARGATKIIELAEKLESLTKAPGWKEYIDLIDQLIEKEMLGLQTLKMDNDYYKHIGFTQMLLYIRELPTIVKDKKIREFLLHQGRVKAATTASGGLLNHYRKQKVFALDKIKQIFTSGKLEDHKQQHGEDIYRQQG